jgi:hypothetical protein
MYHWIRSGSSFWTHLIVHLGDVDQAEAHFDPFADSYNFWHKKGAHLRRMYHGPRNHFGHTRWYSYVMHVKWTVVLVCLEIVLVSEQDCCTVCAEGTIGLEIILNAPDGTPR